MAPKKKTAGKKEPAKKPATKKKGAGKKHHSHDDHPGTIHSHDQETVPCAVNEETE